ncbi:hypothetical protein B566_EDAN018100 [Ephemera danica]|nr:hypothetical protein B566_EDAN018100 [Ephemera danica]
MPLTPIVFTLLIGGAIFGVLPASLSKPLRYAAPDECKWVSLDSIISTTPLLGENNEETQDATSSASSTQPVMDETSSKEQVALLCRVRTINSELEHTNFSVIQPQHTALLRIECSDTLFFQSSLSTDSFKPLVELKELSIEYCKLGNLPSGAFRGLRNLRRLSLRTHNTDWSAMALELAQDAFSEVPLLERLDLAENNMWTLPEGVFCPLTALRALNITRNRLRDVKSLQFGVTKGCGANLAVLDISNNSLDSLPTEVFTGLARLKKLFLQSNGINFVADRALAGLTSLTELNLASNKIASVPPEFFIDSRNIREIHLQNNSISVLAPGLFSGLDQLLILDISRNELSSEWVNSATLTGLVRLVILDVSYNKLTKLEINIFRDLYSLQILRLENNNIESLPDKCFNALTNLHTLVLSHNRLATIDAHSLSGLHVLSLLSIDNNSIRTIHPAALRNVSSVRDLHLNGNRLLEAPRALVDVRMLRTLDLGENLIATVDNASFTDLRHLYGLRLTENNIVNISKSAFSKLSALKILNLSRNKIVSVDHGAFDDNSNLQAIRLDGNLLTDVSGLFTHLPNLVWLNVSDNRLSWFDYALVPPGLQWLDLHANRLTELGNHLELSGVQLRLSTLDASANRLTELAGSSIPDSVELLFLSDNLISKVQAYTFFKKPNLTRVDLYGNKIASLSPNALRISSVPGSKSLPEFYIGGNPYQCDCTLEWLQRVNLQSSRNQPRVMDLDSIQCSLLYNRGRSYIPLVEALPSQFLCRYETHCFALCHCCDFEACDCEMQCPQGCTCYYDQSWSANVVDCSSGNHTSLPSRIPMDSTQLYLDGNEFGSSLTSHAFIGRKRLHILYLNNSAIDIIHNRTFNGLKGLKILHLESNLIQHLKGYEFDGGLSESLSELYLHANQITSIHESTFNTLRELRVLTLHGNQLHNFPVWKLQMVHLQSVTLSKNPWVCECEYVQQYRDWLHSAGVIVQDGAQVQCVKNQTMDTIEDLTTDTVSYTHYSILESDFNETLCANRTIAIQVIPTSKTILTDHIVQDYLPLLIATLVAFLVVLTIIIVLFIYRQEMRIWCYSKYGIRLFHRNSDKTETAVNDRDKIFDAFISYSSKDEAWVAEELAPVLERGDPSYKLCLHYRDFPVGSYIADTIVQAVESSRRTIMVLSENFIRSEWCRFEFKSAHHQVLRDRRRRLIVVLLGDIPHRELDPDIRLYLKTNTYLQWGDKLFWEKLRYALPDVPNNQRNRRNNNLTSRGQQNTTSNVVVSTTLQLNQRPPSNNNSNNHNIHHNMSRHSHNHGANNSTTSVAIHI